MSFKTYSLLQGTIADFSQDVHPAIVTAWDRGCLKLSNQGTHFGFVYEGHPILHRNAQETYTLHPGMYFSLPSAGSIDGETSSGIVITHLKFQGTFSIGGPIELAGRFAYIDGGTNSLLIPPLYQGDPSFYSLYFPPDVDQTLHTHTSYRVGAIVQGSGVCETPDGITDLNPGIIFFIPSDYPHKFRTSEDSLTLVVFHPDSDTGFTHEDNPMLRRTMVNGISAAQLPDLHTKLPKVRSCTNLSS
jgi:quercetin dioxygenase-like cupin family protein